MKSIIFEKIEKVLKNYKNVNEIFEAYRYNEFLEKKYIVDEIKECLEYEYNKFTYVFEIKEINDKYKIISINLYGQNFEIFYN